MNFGACVTVRLSSERLPRKALVDVCGEPSIYWLCRQLQNSAIPFVICTSSESSDDDMEKYCLRNSIDCFRGSELDVLGRMVGAAKTFGFDVFLRITGDDLFVDPDYVKLATERYDGSDFAYTNLPKGTDFQMVNLDYAVNTLREWEGRDTEYLTWIFNSAPRQQFLKMMDTDVNYAFELDNADDLDNIRLLVESLKDREVFHVHDLIDVATESGRFPIKDTIDRRTCDVIT